MNNNGNYLTSDPSRDLSIARKLTLAILTIFVAFVFTNNLLFVEYEISGKSMEDTLHDGDKVVVNTLSKKPKHDDVIVFKHDNDVYIKRVIGIPGDIVEIDNGDVYVNDELHSTDDFYFEDGHDLEGNLNVQFFSTCELENSKCEIPNGEYFVLGDNREKSKDSRHIGYVHDDDIIGTVYESEFFKK